MTPPAAEALIEVADGVLIRDMLTIERAIDAFLADGRARGWPENTTIRNYARTLYQFADRFPNGTDVGKITADDFRDYRAARQRKRLAASTIALDETIIASFTSWLLVNGKIKRDPMGAVRRTRKPKPHDLDVVSVSTAPEPVVERGPTQLMLAPIGVTMRPQRQFSSDELVDDLLGALLRGETVA